MSDQLSPPARETVNPANLWPEQVGLGCSLSSPFRHDFPLTADDDHNNSYESLDPLDPLQSFVSLDQAFTVPDYCVCGLDAQAIPARLIGYLRHEAHCPRTAELDQGQYKPILDWIAQFDTSRAHNDGNVQEFTVRICQVMEELSTGLATAQADVKSLEQRLRGQLHDREHRKGGKIVDTEIK